MWYLIDNTTNKKIGSSTQPEKRKNAEGAMISNKPEAEAGRTWVWSDDVLTNTLSNITWTQSAGFSGTTIQD